MTTNSQTDNDSHILFFQRRKRNENWVVDTLSISIQHIRTLFYLWCNLVVTMPETLSDNIIIVSNRIIHSIK